MLVLINEEQAGLELVLAVGDPSVLVSVVISVSWQYMLLFVWSFDVWSVAPLVYVAHP